MTATIAVPQPDGPVEVTLTELGAGRPVLLLHGGGGPETMLGLAHQLAAGDSRRVLVPSHPGFGGTARPESVTTVRQVGAIYGALLAELGLDDVAVIGNSLGGWIAAETALAAPDRVSSLVLLDAVGLASTANPVVDFFNLDPGDMFARSFADPARFAVDPSTFTPEQQAIGAGNMATLALFGGPTMADPTLADRLGAVTARTTVVWGDHDGIVTPDYGREYADAIPGATFVLMEATGHLPQVESPDQLAPIIDDAI